MCLGRLWLPPSSKVATRPLAAQRDHAMLLQGRDVLATHSTVRYGLRLLQRGSLHGPAERLLKRPLGSSCAGVRVRNGQAREPPRPSRERETRNQLRLVLFRRYKLTGE